MKAGVHVGITAAEYNADPAPEPSLSSTIARLLVTRSPLHAWTAHPRLNPNHRPVLMNQLDLGSAAHAYLLGTTELEIFDPQDYIGPRGGEPKGWTNDSIKLARDRARADGKIPILSRDMIAVGQMVTIALETIAKCDDLGGLTLADGTPEQTLLWQERDGMWCRARPDWMSHDRRVQISYKSTATSANPNDWVRTGLGIGFDLQEGVYKRGNEKTGGPQGGHYLTLVQENTPPYACSWLGLDPEFSALADEKTNEAIELWRRCMLSGRWPGYPPRIHWLMAPPWAKMRWEDRPLMSERFGEQPPEQKPLSDDDMDDQLFDRLQP